MPMSLTKLPWQAQVGAFLVVSIASVGGFYYTYAMPAQAEIASRRTNLEAMQADIRKGQETARRLPEFEQQVEDLEIRLEELRLVLPEEKDVGELLRRIQSIANESDLTIKGFKPQPIATKELHAEWPILLELDGTYHDLGLFFDRLSKFSRIINVSDVNIKAKDDPDQTATISAVCLATTFVLLDAEELKRKQEELEKEKQKQQQRRRPRAAESTE